MKQEGKAKALREWLQSWEGFSKFTRLNASVDSAEENSVTIVSNDEVQQRYINGTALRDYTFEVRIGATWSSGNDTINETAQAWGEQLHDWLTSEAGYPAWEGVEFVELVPLSNTPTLQAVDEGQRTALYSFQARITYRE